MGKDAVLDNPNYIWVWLWSNNGNCVKMPPPMLYRTVAEACSAARIDDKEHFARMRAIAASDVAIQEIYTWLRNLDITGFDVNDTPETDFKKGMAETSLTHTQRYIVDVCNGRRYFNIDPVKVTKVLKSVLYADYGAWAVEEGIQKKFVSPLTNFTEAVKNLDIACKEARYKDADGLAAKGSCFHFQISEIEAIMQKFQRNKEWKLLAAEPVLEVGEDDD